MKKALILLAIGIIFLAIDIQVPIGEDYPPMEMVDELGDEIQGKIINNLIGIRPYIDIFSDTLGYAFLLIASLFLLKYNFNIIFAMICIPISIYLKITMIKLPYSLVLRELYLKMAGYHFLTAAFEILIEFIIIKGVISVLQCTQTKWSVNELMVGWILAMISKGVLTGIHFFFGRGIFYSIYSLVMVGATMFYLNRLYLVSKFKLEGNNDKE
ncbi:hypothetical protein [Herbinix luporum]|jgi:hypothetical protein|uniref:Putative membrane protein n=1 Tax=Herbinix luporum TaxID=1679721 RepID=A0A0K8J3X7_9FIRM|nr:hypothetical protein [Herbinix luporum]MDI9489068.1 hypothetical protein [Bacillota bacterium]CUH92167.1 putative membrane protein [Herbinix luporum]HHT56983.1 hypothetical protein [Herbinix luporum]